jgi:hypothetical protein
MEGCGVHSTANDHHSGSLNTKSTYNLIGKSRAQRDDEVSPTVDEPLNPRLHPLSNVAGSFNGTLCCPRAMEVHHAQGLATSGDQRQEPMECEMNIKDWTASLSKGLAPNEQHAPKQWCLKTWCICATNRQNADINPGTLERFGIGIHVAIETTWTSLESFEPNHDHGGLRHEVSKICS